MSYIDLFEDVHLLRRSGKRLKQQNLTDEERDRFSRQRDKYKKYVYADLIQLGIFPGSLLLLYPLDFMATELGINQNLFYMIPVAIGILYLGGWSWRLEERLRQKAEVLLGEPSDDDDEENVF